MWRKRSGLTFTDLSIRPEYNILPLGLAGIGIGERYDAIAFGGNRQHTVSSTAALITAVRGSGKVRPFMSCIVFLLWTDGTAAALIGNMEENGQGINWKAMPCRPGSDKKDMFSKLCEAAGITDVAVFVEGDRGELQPLCMSDEELTELMCKELGIKAMPRH